MMKRLLFVGLLSMVALGLQAAPPAAGEYIMLVGGPSMYQWEKYKAVPHDHWWANFVRAARLRTEQLRSEVGPDAKITWLIYKQGYVDRAELALWQARDPIAIYRERLIAQGALTLTQADALSDQVATRIAGALVQAEASPYPAVDELSCDVYA